MTVLAEEVPEYAFALREDLKDNKEFLPTRAEPKASGWDVRAAMEDRKPLVIKPFQHVKIPLGFRSFCPDGWWWELKPRSSTFAKKNLHALYGTIDETYEGQAIFACQYIPEFNLDETIKVHARNPLWPNSSPTIAPITINFGDAIGQIIPIRRQEMKVVERSNEEYDNDCKNRAGQRGTGGFGSTSK
jgi:dUTPase